MLTAVLLTAMLAAVVPVVGAQTPDAPNGNADAIANGPDLMTASGGLWRDTSPRSFVAAGERLIVPDRYRLVSLDPDTFQAQFFAAPMEGTQAARDNPTVITLPLPYGGAARFRIVESQVMAPALAAQFPEIRTWSGQGIDDPTATVKLDWTPQGFHAMVLSSITGRIFIDPYSRGDTINYISYFTRDHTSRDRSNFEARPPVDPGGLRSAEIKGLMDANPLRTSGTQLRTYRLAVAATGEYTQFFGGTVPLGQAAIVTAINRVTGIYEVEVAVRLQLVANNSSLVYTNAATDPYTNSNGGTMLGQNQTNIDTVIGTANYDIGHVFSTGGGGIAALGVPCRAGLKAQGVTGLSAPVGDGFYVDYVAHEMGHQFGGNHSFNSAAGACGGGNRNASTAYEAGSGSTIMAYAGICGADDLQPHSDTYFHSVSFDEIVTYTTIGNGNSCPVVTSTGNTLPVVTMPAGGFTIPANTPFALTGSATDANGDALTYNWEEYDLGAAGPPDNPLNPPFFRPWPATASPTRTLPRLSDLLANTTVLGEVLPNITRALNFRMTVRDNRAGGGGVVYGTLGFNVTTAAGPFVVTSPNTAVSFAGGSSQTIAWNVANTTAAPVSCASVDILLSTDGGNTFPTTLVAGTPNDGSQAVTIPNTPTASARIKVQCSNNVFFDVSDANFTITGAVGPAVTTGAASGVSLVGATLNGTASSNGASTTVTFDYGLSTSYTNSVTAAQSPLAPGAVNAPVSAAIAGLSCNTQYHFRAVASNTSGTANGSDATFTTAACSTTTPLLASVKSRKTHGTAGTFDLNLVNTPLNPSTEPRSGSSHAIVFVFDKPVISGNASTSEGTATVGAPTFSGNEMTVPLTLVANAQYVTLNVTNVAASGGGSGGTGSVRVGFLFGDTNQSRQVTLSDVGAVNAAALQTVTNANFNLDINVDGKLTVADKGLANANLLIKLPAP
ncbi:MAG TPA: M12 family metallo-peptidase [Casimicrobiaceae bacterium]|nr:M12 family metallo-peptidase [Casimicrobiaceae bacterium]